MSGKTTKPRDFVESLNYPSKKLRPLGKEPISVPRDPLITGYTPFKGKKVSPKNFFYSLFFTAFDTRDYGPDIHRFMRIFSPLNIKKVYLESYRDGYTVPVEILEKAAEDLKKYGVEAAGAVTPTHFSDKQKYNENPSPTGCFLDREGNRKMKKVFELTAFVFNEIIVDDWFFTVCRCPACKKSKGKKSWEEFRAKTIQDAAKKYMINPAKSVNKKVNIILKLPQWHEEYYEKGYDTNKLIPLFDEIAAGTETRDFTKTRFMPSYGAMLFRYINNLTGGKVKKAWFDIYLSDSRIYTEQAYQSLLAGARELILFCAGILPQKNMRPKVENLIENTPKIDRLSSLSRIFTVPVIKEANTKGESLLHQYFLMAGIPAYLTAEKKFREKIVILTEQSCPHARRAGLFNNLLKAGKDVVMTVNFARSMPRHFNIKKLKKEAKITRAKYSGKEGPVTGNIYLENDINNGKNIALLNGAYSLASFYKIKNSRVWVLNLPRSKDEITAHNGEKQEEGYRYILRTEPVMAALRHIFTGYANLKLFDSIKTLHRYKV